MTNHADQTQSMRDWLDNGSRADTRTTYADGSRRDPEYRPGADENPKPRPLAPSPFKTEAQRKGQTA
jgi:hypothetical protein